MSREVSPVLALICLMLPAAIVIIWLYLSVVGRSSLALTALGWGIAGMAAALVLRYLVGLLRR
jgi:hypothetical protein